MEWTLSTDGESVPDHVREESRVQWKRTETRLAEDRTLPPATALAFEVLTAPPSQIAKILSHRVLRDTLENVRRLFPDREVLPVAMARAASQDVFMLPRPGDPKAAQICAPGGVWWAYRIGEGDVMPKNDVPNISVAGMPGALDLTINAEVILRITPLPEPDG